MSIKALTKSTMKDNLEFVVHIKNEYDFWSESDYREEIFDVVKYQFWKTNGINIPVYAVPKNL